MQLDEWLNQWKKVIIPYSEIYQQKDIPYTISCLTKIMRHNFFDRSADFVDRHIILAQNLHDKTKIQLDTIFEFGRREVGFDYASNDLESYLYKNLQYLTSAHSSSAQSRIKKIRNDLDVTDENLPDELKYHYMPSTYTFTWPEVMPGANLMAELEQKGFGHKGLWFKACKGLLVKTIYTNTLFALFDLPIYPIFFVIQLVHEFDASVAPHQLSALPEPFLWSEEESTRIKEKRPFMFPIAGDPRRLITDGEVTMVYKLCYEHINSYFRSIASKSVIFLQKRYIITHSDTRIEYDVLPYSFVFNRDWEERVRKNGLLSYAERVSKDIPQWIKNQDRIIKHWSSMQEVLQAFE